MRMQASIAIIRTGGTGVFIDNSALAHIATDWLSMTDEGSSDAVSLCLVSFKEIAERN